jgi:hypothetical protein
MGTGKSSFLEMWRDLLSKEGAGTRRCGSTQLKLFLGQARCVFVLALDVDVLAAVATNKFGAALSEAPE